VRLIVAALATMTVTVVMGAAAQEPCAYDVDGQADAGNRNRLGEVNRDGGQDAGHRFVADQNRDHCQRDGTGETGEIAKFAGTEREVRICGVPPGVGVGKRRQQQRARVGTHNADRPPRAQ
jgi:hypothetical protein